MAVLRTTQTFGVLAGSWLRRESCPRREEVAGIVWTGIIRVMGCRARSNAFWPMPSGTFPSVCGPLAPHWSLTVGVGLAFALAAGTDSGVRSNGSCSIFRISWDRCGVLIGLLFCWVRHSVALVGFHHSVAPVGFHHSVAPVGFHHSVMSSIHSMLFHSLKLDGPPCSAVELTPVWPLVASCC